MSSDIEYRHWLLRSLPEAWRPYGRLARLDRPIGTWLLLFPCWWGLALAAAEHGEWPSLWHLLLFAVGALVMRGAGCTYNDLVDRELDAKVARTASRPLPSGEIKVKNAQIFLAGQLLVGLLVLIQFNGFTIFLGLLSLLLVASYPFMKRITYWPQAWLGLTFNWGALMGYAAVTGQLSLSALLLYGAGIAWTLGYDTIYAHQDKEDDALVGIKSTALKFGQATQSWLLYFYAATILLLVLAGLAGDLHSLYFAAPIAVAVHFAWQTRTIEIDNPASCLERFRSNSQVGAAVFAGLLLAGLAG